MTDLKRILLVEDSLRDAEITLDALRENNLANRRGEFATRANGLPAVILLDLKMPKVDGRGAAPNQGRCGVEANSRRDHDLFA